MSEQTHRGYWLPAALFATLSLFFLATNTGWSQPATVTVDLEIFNQQGESSWSIYQTEKYAFQQFKIAGPYQAIRPAIVHLPASQGERLFRFSLYHQNLLFMPEKVMVQLSPQFGYFEPKNKYRQYEFEAPGNLPIDDFRIQFQSPGYVLAAELEIPVFSEAYGSLPGPAPVNPSTVPQQYGMPEEYSVFSTVPSALKGVTEQLSSYVIQVAALKKSVRMNRFDGVEGLGELLQYEEGPWTKIQIGWFGSSQDARQMLPTVKARGFKDAFVVKRSFASGGSGAGGTPTSYDQAGVAPQVARPAPYQAETSMLVFSNNTPVAAPSPVAQPDDNEFKQGRITGGFGIVLAEISQLPAAQERMSELDREGVGRMFIRENQLEDPYGAKTSVYQIVHGPYYDRNEAFNNMMLIERQMGLRTFLLEL
ncbi:MAG: hypothetical protein KDC41_08860 [Saprospiraceae bacterium]|nr:hypothetical protein [Saprospiraceae bacterium]